MALSIAFLSFCEHEFDHKLTSLSISGTTFRKGNYPLGLALFQLCSGCWSTEAQLRNCRRGGLHQVEVLEWTACTSSSTQGHWSGHVPEYERVSEEPHAKYPTERPELDVPSGQWFRRVVRRDTVGSVFTWIVKKMRLGTWELFQIIEYIVFYTCHVLV